MADQENIHSIGGYARAAKLSQKHRSLIASKAASTRWSNSNKPQVSNTNTGISRKHARGI